MICVALTVPEEVLNLESASPAYGVARDSTSRRGVGTPHSSTCHGDLTAAGSAGGSALCTARESQTPWTRTSGRGHERTVAIRRRPQKRSVPGCKGAASACCCWNGHGRQVFAPTPGTFEQTKSSMTVLDQQRVVVAPRAAERGCKAQAEHVAVSERAGPLIGCARREGLPESPPESLPIGSTAWCQPLNTHTRSLINFCRHAAAIA